jgi:hypothetical protein
MKSEKGTSKKTIAELHKAGEITLLDAKLSDKHGLAGRVGFLTKEYNELGIKKLTASKKGKKAKPMTRLMAAIYWTIAKCQTGGIPASAIVKLTVDGWPPLAMGIYPYSVAIPQPIIMVSKEEA